MSLWPWAAGAALVALPALRELRRAPRGRRLREEAPGDFAALPGGRTHYTWLGPERGPVAVCVHGLTTPSYVWLGLARKLVAMGFRVLIYDLPGRGYSDAPRGLQTPGMFATQLDGLLAQEGVEGDITLIGYSMGGMIAALWAAKNVHRLRQLILLAPAGMGITLDAKTRWARDWPLVGDWVFHMLYPGAAARALRAQEAEPSSVEGIVDRQRAEMGRRGYVRSVLSSLRGTLRRSSEAAQRNLSAAGVPVLAIWGREDPVVPLSAMGQLSQWNRTVRQVVVDGAGHGLPYTHTDSVAAAIRAHWIAPGP
ncbi:alpha/beta fold hydrolase [Sagittula salina]|uniref:Alpha/beta hydrolase n=1 Tax=Sagittula salina TaxID=2820268 RepID=A0A940MP10_9RHOB|nr:alpha/beta hydrolase [Sagittula salina]